MVNNVRQRRPIRQGTLNGQTLSAIGHRGMSALIRRVENWSAYGVSEGGAVNPEGDIGL